MKLILILGAVVSAGLAAVVLAIWPSGHMGSRDIGCARAEPGRAQEICRAISDSMEWTWMGHAIVSPGWRLTWTGLARVWCTTHITAADQPVLEALRHASSDWRLETSAEELISLLKNAGGGGDAPENSVFNPNNSSYVLKNGCPGL